MNENSETVELPLTDSICPPDLLSSDRGSGQGCGTGLQDGDTGRETMMQIREPFKVAGHGRELPTLMSTGMGHGNGQRKRATSTGKSI